MAEIGELKQVEIARVALGKAKDLIERASFRHATETETWKNHAQEWLYDFPRIMAAIRDIELLDWLKGQPKE